MSKNVKVEVVAVAHTRKSESTPRAYVQLKRDGKAIRLGNDLWDADKIELIVDNAAAVRAAIVLKRVPSVQLPPLPLLPPPFQTAAPVTAAPAPVQLPPGVDLASLLALLQAQMSQLLPLQLLPPLLP